MTSQIHISNNKNRKETSPLSNTPTHAMFESHPFVVQSKSDHHVQQFDLKTSLIQAEKYGHHLSKTNLANQSVPTPVQTKPNVESPVQLVAGQKRKRGQTFLNNITGGITSITGGITRKIAKIKTKKFIKDFQRIKYSLCKNDNHYREWGIS